MKTDNRLNLFRFAGPVLHCFILTALLNVVFVCLDMCMPLITKYLVDNVIIGKKYEHLNLILSAILGIGVFRAVISYSREFLCDYAGSSIGSELRKSLFEKIQTLSANFFDKTNSGELMSRVMDDVNGVWELFTFVLMLMMEVVIHVILLLFSMYRMNWKLSVIPTAGLVFCGFVSLGMEKEIGPLFGAIAEENSSMNNCVQENLSGIRTVKAFLRERYEIAKFRKHNRQYRNLNVEQSKVFAKYYPFLVMMNGLVPLGILVQGGFSVMNGSISLGELTAFIAYSMAIVWPMEMMGWLTGAFVRGITGAKRIDKIFREIPDIQNKSDKEHSLSGNIEFENVSFTAENGNSILNSVNFSISQGQTLGIMGATGSGKSTIINLLTRMYDATSGKIKIDGIDIKDLSLDCLRKNISCVMQDVFLFSETISANVKLGEPSLSEKAVDESLEDACASEFVNRLDEKKNTVIGERGIGLSGGQKQRLTIARSLSRVNAPVLVFDDSTSALDSETEKKIQKMLLKKQGMTKIIIAHRISSVEGADKIIVMDKGSIAEWGTHEELLAKKGLYYQTWQIQTDL